jgi:hypothetical protein
MTVSPSDLMRKLSMKIDQRKAVQLSPEEMDILVLSGGFDAVCAMAREFQRSQCQQRNDLSRFISVAPSPSTLGQGATSKSSGTTTKQDASEALARAQAMLQ